ncbi:MAG: BatD family protein, partial [Planctomycetota bacterium]
MAILSLLVVAAPAIAAELEVKVSSRETVIGVPVIVSVEIKDAEEEVRPVFPEVKGAIVRPVPGASRNSMTQIINGRMTRTVSTTFQYRIVPTEPGVLTIPPVTAEVDGQTLRSEPLRISVVRSESSDLAFLEIASKAAEVYLGQPVDLTLRLWLKPYTDRRMNVRLSARDMWGLVDQEVSNLGPFAEQLQELASQRRIPDDREVLREDDEGNLRAYYVYEVPVRFWPDQGGPLALDEVDLVVIYPTRLERQRRSVFSSRNDLRVADAKPVRVTAEAPDVTVLAPPESGQPAWYSGAVGRYRIDVRARPTEVAVGDPITITIELTDLTR